MREALLGLCEPAPGARPRAAPASSSVLAARRRRRRARAIGWVDDRAQAARPRARRGRARARAAAAAAAGGTRRVALRLGFAAPRVASVLFRRSSAIAPFVENRVLAPTASALPATLGEQGAPVAAQFGRRLPMRAARAEVLWTGGGLGCVRTHARPRLEEARDLGVALLLRHVERRAAVPGLRDVGALLGVAARASTWPFWHAMNSGAAPSLSAWPTSASFSISSRATSTWPHVHATNSGAVPFSSAWPTWRPSRSAAAGVGVAVLARHLQRRNPPAIHLTDVGAALDGARAARSTRRSTPSTAATSRPAPRATPRRRPRAAGARRRVAYMAARYAASDLPPASHPRRRRRAPPATRPSARPRRPQSASRHGPPGSAALTSTPSSTSSAARSACPRRPRAAAAAVARGRELAVAGGRVLQPLDPRAPRRRRRRRRRERPRLHTGAVARLVPRPLQPRQIRPRVRPPAPRGLVQRRVARDAVDRRDEVDDGLELPQQRNVARRGRACLLYT